jgi:hypothetical protein
VLYEFDIYAINGVLYDFDMLYMVFDMTLICYTWYVIFRVKNDFEESCKGTSNPQNSSLNDSLAVWGWSVHYAPAPENIYW